MKPSPAPIVRPATPTQFNFRFSADRRFKEKLERLAEVLGVENPEKNMAEILEKAVDLALDRKDPKRKRERRLAKARGSKPRPDEVSTPSRYIASEVRARVHERAGYQCEYAVGTERGAPPAPGSRSSTNARSPSSEPTTSATCASCARGTIG